MRQSLAILIAAMLLSPLGAAQEPAILQIRIVEGDSAVYPMGSRATRGITLQVTDESGRPVDNAIVSFRLPEDGPSGLFSNGTRTEIATTHPDGRASAWGMQWNRTPGMLEVRITAAKGATRAGIVCSQYLTDAEQAAPLKIHGSFMSHKWLWIAAAGAGAAIGIAAGAIGKGSPPPAQPSGLTIGPPTISLGHP